MALAVVLAMLPFYILSRTLVPTLVSFCCQRRWSFYEAKLVSMRPLRVEKTALLMAKTLQATRRYHLRIGERFDRLFEKLHVQYRSGLVWALSHRLIVCVLFAVFCAASFSLFPIPWPRLLSIS